MKIRGYVTLSIVILSVVLCLFIVGCSPTEGNESENNGPIKIAFNNQWPGYDQIYIAQEKGFFEKNGVEVELISTNDGVKTAEIYRNEEADGLFHVYTDIIFLNSEGIPTKIVYVDDYSDTADVIVGKKEFKTIADLKDKKIGIQSVNTFSHLFVLSLLENEGVKEGEIEFKQVLAQDVLKELEAGTIVAGHTWEPTTSLAVEKGYKILGKAGDIPGIITDVLAFNAKIIEERPEDVQAVVKSILEAKEYLETNKEESLEIMVRSTGLSKEAIEEGINGVYVPNLEENIAAMKDTEKTTSLYTSGRRISDFYTSRGQLSEIPKLDEIIEPKFVNNIELQD